MVKKVGMKSFPPVVKETGLLFRSSCGFRRNPLPIKTMEVKIGVRNNTHVYWYSKCTTFRRQKQTNGKRCSVFTKLNNILRAKIKAIVDATLKNPKGKTKPGITPNLGTKKD